MKNILIVDDEAFAREAIVENVSWAEYDIEALSAANGREALLKLSEKKIDLIITDIKMPGMDGLELVRRIREYSPETGVLMLSSYNEFELVRAAMQLGAMDYLFKPTMMPDSILTAVRESLEKLQGNRKLAAQGKSRKREKETETRKRFFQKLLHGEEGRDADIKKLLNQWNLHHVHHVCIINFTVVKYQQSLKKVFADKMELMRFSVENVLNESMQKHFGCCMAESSFYEYTAVSWSEKELEREEGRKRISEQIHECISFLKAYYGIEFEVGISSEGSNFENLCTQYLEAKEAAQRADINYRPVCRYSENGGSFARELSLALEFISENIGNKELSLQMVSGHIGISKNYFSRLFKEAMQINFIDYVTKMRMEAARKLYLNSDMKIYEIAEKVGYSDWHYLYALYKKNYGHSLSQERRD